MSHSQGFQFKRFFIAHDQCAMKVNTDGILLGALADVCQAKHILDLGTGTGLIAIMLAQRTACDSQITAVELDCKAAEQARLNALNSPWAERLHILQGDLMRLAFETAFDLIVANPPYFEHSPASRNRQRDLARTVIDSHFAWLNQAKNWLSPTGKICFILPFEAGERLIEQAKSIDLHCIECWHIQTKPTKAPKRMVLSFATTAQPNSPKTLVIYQQDNQYTAEFKHLTRDFYLNF